MTKKSGHKLFFFKYRNENMPSFSRKSDNQVVNWRENATLKILFPSTKLSFFSPSPGEGRLTLPRLKVGDSWQQEVMVRTLKSFQIFPNCNKPCDISENRYTPEKVQAMEIGFARNRIQYDWKIAQDGICLEFTGRKIMYFLLGILKIHSFISSCHQI